MKRVLQIISLSKWRYHVITGKLLYGGFISENFLCLAILRWFHYMKRNEIDVTTDVNHLIVSFSFKLP